jgi:hypothetical protein
MVTTNSWQVHSTIRIPIVQEMDMMASTPGKMPETSKRLEKKRMHKSH